MSKFYLKLIVSCISLLFSVSAFSQISVTATTGTTGPTTYTTLKLAFDAINAGTHTGAITISVTGNTTETAQALLNASGTGSSSYTSILIKPSSGTTATITGATSTTLIDLNGADNVTIDGSNTAGGTTKDLTISNTGTSNTIRLVNGASNNVIKNSLIKGATTTSGVIVISSSTATAGNNSNLVQNNDITRSGAGPMAVGIFNTGTSGKPNSDNIYRNNRISEFSLNGFLDGNGTSGYSSNTLVEGNEFFQTTTRTTAVTAIRTNHATGIVNLTISKNKIYDMLSSYTGTSFTAGIDLYDAASVTIVNNIINLDVATASVLIGIAQETGAGAVIKVYYNTVVVKGTTTGTNASYAFIKNYSSTGDDVKNNLFINTRTSSGTGKQYATGNIETGTMSSNNNDLYSVGNANNIVGVTTAGDHATLAAWQAATSQDGNSVSVLPVFVSATDLHLNAASNAGLDSKGVSVSGVTTDIDGDTRSVTPDLGADEMPASADVTGPSISFDALSFTCSPSDRTVTATIADATGVPTSGGLVPRIYYRKAAGTWYSQAGTLTSGNGTSGTWTFTIVNADMGGVTNGNTIEYYIIAQDIMATPNISSSPAGVTATNVNTVSSHPASPASYIFGAALNGTYTVGAAGAYTTITAAIAAYNQGCLAGPVVFSLTDANYGAGETFPIVISSSLASATNTLTIKPAPGVSPVITGSGTGAIFHLKGADYVTIDGSNVVSGTTRNLTITSSSANTSAIVWIASENASNPATYNTVKNTIMYGNTSSLPVGILAGGSAFGTEAEAANSNNSIINNQVFKAQNAIYVYGKAAPADDGWLIRGNDIGSATAADKILLRGIYVVNMQNFVISGNNISGVVTPTTSTTTATGISLVLSLANGQVYGNKISDIKNTNTGGYGSNGIQLAGSATSSNVLVHNNFISDVASVGFAGAGVGDNGYGIVVSGGTGYSIYYNTVLMNTNQTLTTGRPSAMLITSAVTTTGAINLRNNMFVNTQTVGTERYTIYSAAANTVFAAIDHNNYYTTGPNLGYIGTARSNLAAIQAGFGGNTNSVSALPVFVSSTDLHLATSGNTAVEDKGTAIAGVTVDIDNDARHASTPDLGADEIVTVCLAPAITTQPTAQAACAEGTATFSVTATGTGLTYQWRKGGVNVSGATSSTLTLNNISAADAATYDVVITGACGNVTSAAVTLTVNPKPVASFTAAAGTPCNSYTFTNTSTIASGSIVAYSWNFGDAGTSTLQNPTHTYTAPGNYNVTLTVTSNSGCVSVVFTQALVVSAPPAITTQPTNQTSCTGGNVSFTVAATGSGLTYQWYKAAAPITGATAATYTITGVTAGDAANYYVVVSGTCAPAVTSSTVSLTISSSPVINTQPAPVTACAGSTATFSVAATGSGLTYQWRKGGSNISGATSSSFVINPVSGTDAGSYDVVVTSTTCGTSVTSTAVNLTVNAATSITTHPLSQSVCPGANVSFTVVASGSTLTYQWKKNGANISGANSATLNLTAVTAGDAASYTVEVSGGCGTVTSNAAVLTVGSGTGWTGTVNNDWNNANNWCNGVPGSTTDITINAGTPNAPTINSVANVRNLTIASGVTLTITASGRLNIYGNYTNNGTLSASSGTVAFQGSSMQTVSGISAGTIIINGAGITLAGGLTAGTALTLTAGNIITDNNLVTLNGSTAGSVSSHIVTNGTGSVLANNVNNAYTIPVGPDAASYNPVLISNGQAKNYSVKVITGITPAILNNAKGINRTWAVIPSSAPAAPVTITLQYADAEANASATGSAAMDVGVHSGTAWYLVSQAGGVTPTGTAASRQVTVQTLAFGPMAVANVGGIGTLTSLPAIDADITSAVLMPNAFESETLLKLQVKRSMKINWVITDASGRVVMTFSRQANAGSNDIPLKLSHLSGGLYFLKGYNERGGTGVLRMIKL